MITKFFSATLSSMRTKSPYIATSEDPYHISIGGIVPNSKGEILTHYFESHYFENNGMALDFYILMRESLENGETLEECLTRGFMEEFGATVQIKSYIGSIISNFYRAGDVLVQKTTLYFLCDLVELNPDLREKGEVEADSETRWVNKKDLIEKMSEQGKRTERNDLDESEVLKRI